MQYKTNKKQWLVSSILALTMLVTSFAYAKTTTTAPTPATCITAKIHVADNTKHGNQWSSWDAWRDVTMTLTNNCSGAQDLRSALIQFESPKAVNSSYGDFSAVSYPTINVTSTSESATSEKVSVALAFAEGSQWWKPKSELAPGASITLQFGMSTLNPINLSGMANSVKVFLETPPPPPVNDGAITIKAPAAPGSDVEHHEAKATLTGPNNYHHVVNLKWNHEATMNSLAYGAYQVVTSNIGEYVGQPNAPINLTASSKNATQTLIYEKPIAPAKLTVNMEAAPASSLENRHVMVKNITHSEAAQDIVVPWSHHYTLENLKSGDHYKVWTATFKHNGISYTPKCDNVVCDSEAQAYTFQANSANHKNISVTYQKGPEPTYIPVTGNVTGLPSGANVEVTLQGSDQSYSKEVTLGHHKIADVVAGQYNVTSATYSHDGKTYRATLANPYNIAAATTINIPYSEAPAMNKQLVAYWTSWTTQDLMKIQDKISKVTIFNLSFANIDPSTLQLVGSDNMLKPGYWVYNRWAQYKLAHPEKKFVVAVGGASYGSVWTNTLKVSNATTIANNIADLLSKKMPVCKDDWTDCTQPGKEADIVGYVTLDGIDLDAEHSGRFSDSESDALIALIKALHANPKMAGKLITLTPLSVAADPDTCQWQAGPECSFVGSQHSGEMRKVMEETHNLLNYVHIMAYDAGRNYPYKIAVANYSKLVGADKVNLGVDFESQWDPVSRFVESEAELKARVSWVANDSDIAGVMVWALGASPSGYGYEDQIRLINDFGNILNP